MKLIIQIPCLNEAATLHCVVSDLPDSIPGIDVIETLVVDDGSTDGTAAAALGLGVNHVVRHHCHRGLAAAFATGLNASLALGADIIVNTDGDHQYAGAEIARLVDPIIRGRAELVIGDRRPATDLRLSLLRRRLQQLGQRLVSFLAGQRMDDPVSGFRAISRQAACRLHIVTSYSYTIETLLQAASKGIAIEFVTVHTNPPTRPSRLIRNLPQFLWRSGITIVRVFFQFRPLSVLVGFSGALAMAGILPIVRFLWFWLSGNGSGHVQSLILGGTLVVLSGLCLVAGLIADLIATNRQLLEMILERLKQTESASAVREPEVSSP